MKIVAITKYKQGEIFEMLKKLGWSQREFSKRTGLHPYTISKILNLQMKPSEDQANAIQRAFGEAGHYLDVTEIWPESFVGFSIPLTTVYIKDFNDSELIDYASIENARIINNAKHLQNTIDERIDKLKSKQKSRIKNVIQIRFLEKKSLKELGEKFGVGVERARQIQNKFFTTFRNKSSIKDIEESCNSRPDDIN